ncbi:MAG: Asp23/Gls24 family envelope stress response protein [Planctomycetota bacterium]|jgi:uncharacterized alkaline shock family protein YloU
MAVAEARKSGRKSARARTVDGDLVFDRAVFTDIASRVLDDIRDVRQTAGDLMKGFLGRLLARGPARPGITVEERGEQIAFHIEVVARHGVNFYDLWREIQRRIAERVRQMTGRSCVVNVNVRGVTL